MIETFFNNYTFLDLIEKNYNFLFIKKFNNNFLNIQINLKKKLKKKKKFFFIKYWKILEKFTNQLGQFDWSSLIKKKKNLKWMLFNNKNSKKILYYIFHIYEKYNCMEYLYFNIKLWSFFKKKKFNIIKIYNLNKITKYYKNLQIKNFFEIKYIWKINLKKNYLLFN